MCDSPNTRSLITRIQESWMGRWEGESRTQNSLGGKKHEARGPEGKARLRGHKSSFTQKHGQSHTHTQRGSRASGPERLQALVESRLAYSLALLRSAPSSLSDPQTPPGLTLSPEEMVRGGEGRRAWPQAQLLCSLPITQPSSFPVFPKASQS